MARASNVVRFRVAAGVACLVNLTIPTPASHPETAEAMGILDRFKTQPKWKSADPTVRAAGVQEIPEDEQDLLASLARSDDDPRVRRAAVSKLGTVAVLADAVRSDADESVRDEAAGVLQAAYGHRAREIGDLIKGYRFDEALRALRELAAGSGE